MLPFITGLFLFSFGESRSLEGRVVSYWGQPVSGAPVYLITVETTETLPVRSVKTDDRGGFTLSPPFFDAPMLLLAFDPKMGWGWEKILVTTDQPVLVRLLLGKPLEGQLLPKLSTKVRLTRLEPLTLFGPLFEPLNLEAIRLPFIETRSNSNGRFRFPLVPLGMKVTVSLPDLGWEWTITGDESHRFSLPPLGILSGTVVTAEGGRALGSAKVSLVPASVRHPSGQPREVTVTTNRLGRFRARLPIGQWFAWVKDGDSGWITKPVLATVNPDSEVSVRLTAQKPGIVRGWVADVVTRFPLTQLPVKAETRSHGLWVSSDGATRTLEGAYEIHLPDGLWRLFVADPDWESQAVELEIKGGAVLEAPAIFAKRKPFANLRPIRFDGKEAVTFVANRQGKRRVGHPERPLVWTLQKSVPETLFLCSPDKSEWARVDASLPSTIIIRLEPGIRINGTVRDQKGNPIGNCVVVLSCRWTRDDPPIDLNATITDEQGNFQIGSPRADAIRLKAVARQGQSVSQWIRPESPTLVLGLTVKEKIREFSEERWKN
ncbi:MAG: carboxypeptidase-like regulatory domain-containing protein [Armatimonadetes bacterium]|nr:carboxypeptidase-like regulatory domain-containing protein [Armatimonadota bacterium]MDW8122101.1 carboxypeptidase-like regulatory domain-containing protein [Armatimonadota bacterium]